jgi:hypothetical protein
MESVDDIMAKLKDATYFTKIDLGYWQIPVAENCSRFSAFATD